jgi:periplasmic protein TonB
MIAAALAPSARARFAVVVAVVAFHGAVFLPWSGGSEPNVGLTPIEVTVVPLGDSPTDSAAAAAAPPAEALVPQASPPADQPVNEEPPSEILPIPTPAPSLVQLPDEAAPPQPKPESARKPKPEPPRKPKPRTVNVKSAHSDDGSAAVSSAASRKGAADGQIGVTGATRASYAGLVVAELNRHKRYPEASRRNREQGSVAVVFSIDASGRVAHYAITRSSGNAALDRAVDVMMSSARPPPPPGGSFRGSFVANFHLDR